MPYFLWLFAMVLLDAPQPQAGSPKPGAATPKAEPLTTGERKCFEWFDTLGFPDLKTAPFVMVATGTTVSLDSRAQENCYLHAFLLKDDGTRFTVFTPALDTLTFTKTGPRVPKTAQIGYQVVDLKGQVEQFLKHFWDTKLEPWDFPGTGCEPDYGTRRGLCHFVIARACAARGLDSLAHQLAQTAKYCMDRQDGRGLLELVQDRTAHALTWSATEKFATPSIPRKDILARFEWLERHFPRGADSQSIKETARLLRQMMAEDNSHDRRPRKADKDLTKEERIAELIFQLRNQQDLEEDISDFIRMNRSPRSPVSQLAKLSHAAVPQMIDALGDRRFTRSVIENQESGYPKVPRVRDCALAILGEIARLRSPTKRLIEEWWQGVRIKQAPQAAQTPVDAPAGEEKYACLHCSCAFGKQFAIAVPERALQKAPKWEKGASNPPLAARKAIDIANQAKVRLIPDDSKDPLLFKRASLVPLSGTWTWQVEYEAKDRGTRPANLLLVVLMDGTLVEPIVSPDPYAPASGGK
jgi:hypothetical protein